MTKLDIYCGLLGAGKTTVISRMLKTAYVGYRVAIIENEVGKVNLDSEELRKTSVEVREITSGCVCCSLRGNFTEAMAQLVATEKPEYIIVEPSGVANLEDVIGACTETEGVELNRIIMIIKANKFRLIKKVVGEFFDDQIKMAQTVYLNFTETMSMEEIEEVQKDLWEINPDLVIINVPLDDISEEIFPDPGQNRESYFHGSALQDYHDHEDHHDHDHHDHHDHDHDHHDHEDEEGTLQFCYAFQYPVNDEKMEEVFALMQSDRCGEIWRAKGYLKKEDGTILKADYIFGDSYRETGSLIAESKLNLLVMIGQDIAPGVLEAELKKIDTGLQ